MGDESNRNYDVFLSYSSKDKNWADAACAVLERHRVRCWIAPRDITPGDEWQAAIMKGLNGSRILVLIFSGHANASEQVRREVERAGSRGMMILPVRIEDVRPDGAMEYSLGNRHWLDAFTPPVEKQLEFLAQSVKTLLGRDIESVAPAPPKPGAVAPEPRRPRAFWLIAIAALLFGVIALGVIMIAIKSRNGETKPTVSRDPPKQADGEGKGHTNPAADSSGAKPPTPPTAPNRTPLAGPARLAYVNGGVWTVEGDQLVKEDLKTSAVRFGAEGWSDYDLTFEARKSDGTGGFGALFRDNEAKHYAFAAGGRNQEHGSVLFRNTKLGDGYTVIWSSPGTIQRHIWYKMKISLRESRIRIELDGDVLYEGTDDFSQNGRVALRFRDAAGRFRNIKVTAPDGAVLWEGPPDLPEK